jgi:hypothetical protein
VKFLQRHFRVELCLSFPKECIYTKSTGHKFQLLTKTSNVINFVNAFSHCMRLHCRNKCVCVNCFINNLFAIQWCWTSINFHFFHKRVTRGGQFLVSASLCVATRHTLFESFQCDVLLDDKSPEIMQCQHTFIVRLYPFFVSLKRK